MELLDTTVFILLLDRALSVHTTNVLSKEAIQKMQDRQKPMSGIF